MKESNFDRLLQRYLAGQLSGPEKVKFEAWLDVVKTQYKADLLLSKEDEDRLFSKITSQVDGVEEIKTFRPANQKTRSIFHNTWFRVAAAILLVLASSYTIWYVTVSNPIRYELVAAAENEKHILTDGTLVWLEKGSTLSYTEKAGEVLRHVELEGEALFEVAKDPANPFTIACGDITIRVLGTSFRVKTGKANVELKVLTGRVTLTSPANQRGVDVEPLERVIYTTGGNVEKQRMVADEVAAITAATEYNMQFDDATMDQVTARIAKKFNVELTVENQQVYRCHLTADFTDNSLDVTLQMLSELLDVTYQIDKNVVTISGSGCN